ncbi:MAG: response regulator [Planctomycetota bacterium]
MVRPMILCIDDQAEVLAAVTKDLDVLEPLFDIAACDDAADAREVLGEALASGQDVAVIVADCVMPGEDGVSLLHWVQEDGRLPHARKILLTGQASHDQTIQAINEAHVDRYVRKPWQSGELRQAVQESVTHWVFDSGRDWQDYRSVLDQKVLLNRLHG